MPLPFIIILSTFLRLPVSQTSRNLLLLPSLFFQVALRCKPYVSLVLFSSVVCLPYFYICLHLPTSPPPSFRSYLIFFKASKTINKKSTYEKRVLS